MEQQTIFEYTGPPARKKPSGARTALVAGVAALVAALAVGLTPLGRLAEGNPLSALTSVGTSAPISGTSTLSPSEVARVADKVDDGVVNVNTVLGYENGRAAGTGMVITSTGQVLTNNHVVQGATKITATVVDTGKTYTAKVVGTSPTEDVALIQLEGVSGLKTISTAPLSSVAVGDAVVAFGNAGGKGGSVATGRVTALNRTITAAEDDGSNAQRLRGLIEVDAPVEPGDSGGPLANDKGEVIGMDSAAGESGGLRTRSGQVTGTTSRGYAIPIEHAMSIASQIQSGQGSSTVRIGSPGFLGVQLANNSTTLSGVERGTPAESIGLAAGDTITSVNGRPVGSGAELSSLLKAQKPGDQVAIGWTDRSGRDHSAKAALIAGPAD